MKKFYLMLAACAAFSMNALAQEAQSATLTVGDYDGATSMVEGSFWDVAPTTFYVAHTGSQMIYTADDLADFDGKEEVKITKLTYRFYNEGFDDITRDVKLYLQEIDATAFEVIDGVKQFFDFDASALVLEFEGYYSLLDYYGMDGEMEFDLSNAPFEVTPGKNLLVTVIFDAQEDDNCTDGTLVQFYNSGLRNRVMTYTNNTVSFVDYTETEDFPKATATLGCGTNIDLPVTKIDYTYVDAVDTGIEEMKTSNAADGAYYNMMGQKLDGNHLPAGIYIHNGKKYIAK